MHADVIDKVYLHKYGKETLMEKGEKDTSYRSLSGFKIIRINRNF